MGTASAAQNQQVMSIIRKVAPALSFVATWWQPASVQLYFAATSCLAYGQNFLLSKPGFRRRVGIQPLPSKSGAAAATSAGYRGTMTKASGPPPPDLDAKSSAMAEEESARAAEDRRAGRFSLRASLGRLNAKARKYMGGYLEKQARMSRRERDNAKQYEKKRREEIKEEKWRRGESD